MVDNRSYYAVLIGKYRELAGARCKAPTRSVDESTLYVNKEGNEKSEGARDGPGEVIPSFSRCSLCKISATEALNLHDARLVYFPPFAE